MINTRQISLCVLILLLIYLFYMYIYDGTERIQSVINNKFYNVRSTKGKETNANLLALLDLKLNTIVESLGNSIYLPNINVQRLILNWNRGVSIKEMGKMENEAAYVINKQYMSFCLPEDTSKTLDSINLMTYVAIHELSHIMSNETGHGSEFVKNFEFLLNYSKGLEYFDPTANKYLPVYIQLDKLNTSDNYCGVPLINSIK